MFTSLVHSVLVACTPETLQTPASKRPSTLCWRVAFVALSVAHGLLGCPTQSHQGNLSGSQKVRVFDPINDALHVRLKERASEYTSYETFKLWTGTYNLNGKSHGSESLLPWIFPAPGPAVTLCWERAASDSL